MKYVILHENSSCEIIRLKSDNAYAFSPLTALRFKEHDYKSMKAPTTYSLFVSPILKMCIGLWKTTWMDVIVPIGKATYFLTARSYIYNITVN